MDIAVGIFIALCLWVTMGSLSCIATLACSSILWPDLEADPSDLNTRLIITLGPLVGVLIVVALVTVTVLSAIDFGVEVYNEHRR